MSQGSDAKSFVNKISYFTVASLHDIKHLWDLRSYKLLEFLVFYNFLE